MSTEEKDALRKLIMLISDLRAKDEERYEAHVNFMNETIKMIRAIESQMNKHWSTVLESLTTLNDNISANLDSLLTGINPKGLRETSKSLQEIMDTMNKSVQSMNLEKVLSELKVLKTTPMAAQPARAAISVGQQPEPVTADINIKPPAPGLSAPGGLKGPGGATAPSVTAPPAPEGEYQWVDPHEAAKKKKEEEEEEVHLLKPSDFFGM